MALAADLMQRNARIADFLRHAGWHQAQRSPLTGDASARRYERLAQNGNTAILMDCPQGAGDDPADFVAIARYLQGLGLSPPQIYSADLPNGLLLLEDLGDALFAREITQNPALEPQLYRRAVEILVHIQSAPPPPNLPDLTAGDWAQATQLIFDFYAPQPRLASDDFIKYLFDLIHKYADGPRIVILRDYHAENLLWLPERAGLQSVGLLDFQLAQMGQPVYDLVSLLQDARRDVHPHTQSAMKSHFTALTGVNDDRFQAAYAVVGVQRALRIMGIFARLAQRDQKPHYLTLIPRVWNHLQQNLAHPALTALRQKCADLLPAPTPDYLEKLSRCPPLIP